MRPHFGLCAQAFDGAIEHLDHQFRIDDLVLDLADRDQVDLRLLDLDHRAAGVGEVVIFLVERIGDGENAIRDALVVTILQREGDDLRRDAAELHRLLGEALRGLPHRGVLQVAAPERSGDHRHDARFQIIVQDVAARKPDAAAPGRRRHRMRDVEARHVVGRIGGPALAADVVIEAAVAVGDDVETGEFLVAQIAGQRVLVLLAKAPRHHRLEEMPRAEIFRVPARPRQRAGDGGRQHDVLGGAVHYNSSPKFQPSRWRPVTVDPILERRRRTWKLMIAASRVNVWLPTDVGNIRRGEKSAIVAPWTGKPTATSSGPIRSIRG